MNKIKTTLNAILFLSFFTTFNSCNGQKKSKTIDEANQIGVTVSQLDKTIWAIYQDENKIIGSEVRKMVCFYMMAS